MNETFQLTTCPTCQGFGVTGDPGHYVTCQKCFGEGVWVETKQQHHLVLNLPEMVSIHAHQNFKQSRVLKVGLSVISLIVTAGSFIAILLQGGGIWHQGIANALFGISGLTSMWGISNFQRQATSSKSLDDLATLLNTAPSDQPIPLKPYINTRIEELLPLAAKTAQAYHSSQIDDALLLITLLNQPRIQIILVRLELDFTSLIQDLTKHIEQRKDGTTASLIILPIVRQRIYSGIEQALNKHLPYADIEDILLGYTIDPGPFADIFKQHELSKEDVYAVSRWFAEEQEQMRQWQFWLERGRTRPKGFMNRAWTALPTPFLDQYSTDITKLAGSGNVPTVTVREQEIQQILQALGRTKKNSALLVGEPGVGKESIIGTVALRMLEENVPEILKDKRLVSLDVGALLSSPEKAQENMQRVLDEVMQAGNVILAVPDIQILIGAEGASLDAATLLSQALNHVAVQLVSSATYADYHRFIESNANLTNLLDIIEIKEVTPEQAIEILEEESRQIEGRQKVFLTYPAIEAAVNLAHRYLPDRMLPESAITLLDESASSVQLAKRRWVTKADVEQAIEQKTSIPVRDAAGKEADMLLHLEEHLHKRIIGQEEAVQAVAEALRRARTGLHTGKRPIASFLFVGPTGVGKTETAKAVAAVYFGSEESMIRLDMSEYQDERAIYKLIGAPAANSDSFTEGGALTQPIREHPFSLILLDELEKAYPEVLNLFLQLLDDGRLTENTGRTVFYNNAIVVATSNAGSEELITLMQKGTSPLELPRQILRILQSKFKPEFLNRFDGIIPFHPLKTEEINQIVTLMLKDVQAAALVQGYTLEVTPEAIGKLTSIGFDPLYGARPLRRIIQEKVEGILATKILEKSIQPGDRLLITPEMLN